MTETKQKTEPQPVSRFSKAVTRGTQMNKFLLILCAAGLGVPAWAVEPPFKDAVKVWHFADDAGLKANGVVQTGVKLEGEDKAASLKRGGDGRVADFAGGYLIASGDVRIAGKAMTLLVRARDPSGRWTGTLLARQTPGDPYANLLCGATLDLQQLGARERKRMRDGRSIEFLWRTDPLTERTVPGYETSPNKWGKAWNPNSRDGVLRVAAPVELIAPSDWHDILVRFNGPKLELFVDGVRIDEEFPHGSLRHFHTPFLLGATVRDGVAVPEFQGQVDHVAMWDHALSDNEIIALSGGPERVARRRIEIEGEPVNMPQYWRPPSYNAFVGDPMTFFHDGTFHLFYLTDRKHHAQKWGIGGHPWGHVSSRDLITWEHHPSALDITEQTENALGTGQVVYHEGQYHLYWINCGRRMAWADSPEHRLADNIYVATSAAGILFQKQEEPWARIDYKTGRDANPIVWKAVSGDRFLMYCPNNYKYAGGEVSVKPPWFFESADLRAWKPIDMPAFVKNGPKGWNSCATYHEWNGWFYFHTAGSYWMSRKPLEHPDAEWKKYSIGDAIFVPEVAPFHGNRRIMVGFGQGVGYAHEAVFRELVQHEDGTLGSKWPEEMIPPAKSPMPLKIQPLRGDISGDASSLRLSAKGPATVATAFVDNVPQNVRITLRVTSTSGATAFGLCVRGQGDYAAGRELRFEPGQKCFRYATVPDSAKLSGNRNDLVNVSGLDKPFDLDVIVKDDLIDVCIDKRRTRFHRNTDATGNRLFFFTQNGSVEFKDIVIRQLKEKE